jgi:hypothetical protein
MPTTLKAVKARIQSVMQATDAVANVYTYRRNLNAEVDQAQLVGRDGRMHFWFIYREMTALTDIVINQNFTDQLDTLVIEGFYGVKDADDTEEVFDLIVDQVLQAINNDRRAAPGGTKLNGLVQTAGTPMLRKMDFHMYGQSQVLCHHVEIVMKVTPRYLQ